MVADAEQARGRVWLISGTSSGLGRSLVEATLERGDRAVALTRSSASLADLGARYGGALRAVEVDLADDASVAAAVTRAVEAFGGLDVLVANAGYGLIGSVEDLPDEAWKRLFDINVFGAVRLVRHGAPHVRASRGEILVVASSGNFLRTPVASAYQASKHALVGLTDGLSAEMAPHGVRVRLVVPGPFRTAFASALVFHDPEGSVYTGQVGKIRAAMERMHGTQEGDPDRAARVLLEAVDADRRPGENVVFLGSEAVNTGERRRRADLAEIEAGRERAYAADFPV